MNRENPEDIQKISSGLGKAVLCLLCKPIVSAGCVESGRGAASADCQGGMKKARCNR